jgi:hypothetical protein
LFCQDSKLYVETILDIYTKFSKLVQDVFDNEQGFAAALDKVKNIYSSLEAVVPCISRPVLKSSIILR